MRFLVLLLIVLASNSAPALAQSAKAHSFDDILEVTKVKTVLASSSTQFLYVFEQAQPEVSVPDDLRARAAVHFADSTLYRYVLEAMHERADGEMLLALNEWLFSDWAVEARAIVDAYEPEESLQMFAAGLQADPPRTERARLVARLVRANLPGRFYIGLQKAQRDAVRAAGQALGIEAAAALPEPSDEDKGQSAEDYDLMTFMSFLQRYAPLTDAQLEKQVSALESESGQWYVRVYSESVADAIRRAGAELADGL